MTTDVPSEVPAAANPWRNAFGVVRRLAVESVEAFVADDALSRGAAIAFYSVTALAPVLIIAVWIAGSVFGGNAARNAISWQFETLMGHASARLLSAILEGASSRTAGIGAKLIGIVTLVVAASGVFGEMQAALNMIWKVPAVTVTWRSILGGFLRARATSLGLVASLGFFLLVSLTVTTAMVAFGGYLTAHLPLGFALIWLLNQVLSFAMLALLFAAIYKVLPDVDLSWRDVLVGGVLTTVLFDLGKFLIGFYIGRTEVAARFGAAGALVIVLLWMYYSAQLFLLGAEFTKIYSKYHGTSTAAKAARDATEH